MVNAFQNCNALSKSAWTGVHFQLFWILYWTESCNTAGNYNDKAGNDPPKYGKNNVIANKGHNFDDNILKANLI